MWYLDYARGWACAGRDAMTLATLLALIRSEIPEVLTSLGKSLLVLMERCIEFYARGFRRVAVRGSRERSACPARWNGGDP